MSGEISQELVERMVAHFRAVAEKYAHVKPGAGNFNDELAQVRAIVAELPAPVDPDLIEARGIAIVTLNGAARPEDVAAGGWDSHVAVVSTLAGIRRGRELERAK